MGYIWQQVCSRSCLSNTDKDHIVMARCYVRPCPKLLMGVFPVCTGYYLRKVVQGSTTIEPVPESWAWWVMTSTSVLVPQKSYSSTNCWIMLTMIKRCQNTCLARARSEFPCWPQCTTESTYIGHASIRTRPWITGDYGLVWRITIILFIFFFTSCGRLGVCALFTWGMHYGKNVKPAERERERATLWAMFCWVISSPGVHEDETLRKPKHCCTLLNISGTF